MLTAFYLHCVILLVVATIMAALNSLADELTEAERGSFIRVLPTTAIGISHPRQDVENITPLQLLSNEFKKPAETEVRITTGTLPSAFTSFGDTLSPTQSAALPSAKILPEFRCATFDIKSQTLIRKFLSEQGRQSSSIMIM